MNNFEYFFNQTRQKKCVTKYILDSQHYKINSSPVRIGILSDVHHIYLRTTILLPYHNEEDFESHIGVFLCQSN